MIVLLPRRVVVGFLVTLAFFGLLFWHTDLAQLRAAVAGVEPLWLMVAVIAYFPGVWCRAARWQALLAPLRRVSIERLYPVVVIGYMINDLVPLRAGEFARAGLLRRNEGIAPAATLATIGVERLTDGLVLLLMAAVGGLAAPFDSQIGDLMRGASWLFLIAGGAAFLLAALDQRGVGLLARAGAWLPKRLSGLLELALDHAGQAFAGLGALRSVRGVAAVGWWALAAWTGELAVFWLVAQAFGIGVSVPVLALAMAAANLATSIPASQGGIGPFEYFCAQTFLAFGTAPGVAIAYALVVHAVLILPVVLAGFFHLWRQGLDFSHALRALPQQDRFVQDL